MLKEKSHYEKFKNKFTITDNTTHNILVYTSSHNPEGRMIIKVIECSIQDNILYPLDIYESYCIYYETYEEDDDPIWIITLDDNDVTSL